MVALGQNLLYLGKSGCIRTRVIPFGKKLLYSRKLAKFVHK